MNVVSVGYQRPAHRKELQVVPASRCRVSLIRYRDFVERSGQRRSDGRPESSLSCALRFRPGGTCIDAKARSAEKCLCERGIVPRPRPPLSLLLQPGLLYSLARTKRRHDAVARSTSPKVRSARARGVKDRPRRQPARRRQPSTARVVERGPVRQTLCIADGPTQRSEPR